MHGPAQLAGDLHADTTPRIGFCGEQFVPLPSGGVYWPRENALVLADLHFEKMAAFAARGQLLPPYDTGMTLARLEADLRHTGARKVLALGDSFHREESLALMHPVFRQRLDRLMALVEWVWLSGNHDPAPRGMHAVMRRELHFGTFHMRHEPLKGSPDPLMCGHLHPAARIRINGRSVRRPCFVTDGHLFMLPAYGASTGSLNILSPAFQGLFRLECLEIVMAGSGRTYPVGRQHLIAG